ncbi:MAG: DNA-deoxyinosine glycosylase [Silvibacterium sp.]
MNVKLGLPPVIWENSRILILGTMPGDDSLRMQRYYDRANNQFWKILGTVYDETESPDYSQRLEFLNRRRLAVWDVLQSAQRAGSLDADIKNEVANDFVSLLRTHPGLHVLVFNGSRAHTLFRRYVEKSLVLRVGTPLQMFVFPSTSPTPGRYVLSFEQKVFRWKLLATL